MTDLTPSHNLNVSPEFDYNNTMPPLPMVQVNEVLQNPQNTPDRQTYATNIGSNESLPAPVHIVKATHHNTSGLVSTVIEVDKSASTHTNKNSQSQGSAMGTSTTDYRKPKRALETNSPDHRPDKMINNTSTPPHVYPEEFMPI